MKRWKQYGHICCIYAMHNSKNGRIYIGRTKDLHRRICEHRRHARKDWSPLHDDILAQGMDVFSVEILEECPPDLLDEKEREYIQRYRDVYGENRLYNICAGGIGGQTHDVRGANNPMYGKTVSEERRRYLSAVLTGRKKPEGFGARISAALRGRKKSPEQVARMCRPICVYDMDANQSIRFSSRREMEQTLHCNSSTITGGGIAQKRYRLANGQEAVEAIESAQWIINHCESK